jgi:hypothetical protein
MKEWYLPGWYRRYPKTTLFGHFKSDSPGLYNTRVNRQDFFKIFGRPFYLIKNSFFTSRFSLRRIYTFRDLTKTGNESVSFPVFVAFHLSNIN